MHHFDCFDVEAADDDVEAAASPPLSRAIGDPGSALGGAGGERCLRESAQLLRTCSATLPRPVAGNGVQGGGLRALW